MILTGPEIEQAVRDGRIHVDPYDQSQVNPASYDLTLGDGYRTYDRWTYQSGSPGDTFDTKDPKSIKTVEGSISNGGLKLWPKVGYLMHTRERIRTDHYVACIDGKSSLGRLFMLVHYTAGYVDPGFDGNYTLEVSVLYPTIVYPGMRIAQVRFHAPLGRIRSYQEVGQYVGEAAAGAVQPGVGRLFGK